MRFWGYSQLGDCFSDTGHAEQPLFGGIRAVRFWHRHLEPHPDRNRRNIAKQAPATSTQSRSIHGAGFFLPDDFRQGPLYRCGFNESTQHIG